MSQPVSHVVPGTLPTFVVQAEDVQTFRALQSPEVIFNLIDALERMIFWAESGAIPSQDAILLAREAYRDVTGRYPV